MKRSFPEMTHSPNKQTDCPLSKWMRVKPLLKGNIESQSVSGANQEAAKRDACRGDKSKQPNLPAKLAMAHEGTNAQVSGQISGTAKIDTRHRDGRSATGSTNGPAS